MSLVSKADEEQDPKDEGEQDVRKEEGEDRRPLEYQPRAAALARTGLGAFFSIHKAGDTKSNGIDTIGIKLIGKH